MKEMIIDIDEKGRVLNSKPTTPNYNLIKPNQEDFYDVDDHNNNMDIIDTELHTQAVQIKDCLVKISEVEEQVGNIDVSWDGVTGKPESFPPRPHTHNFDDIINKYRDARGEGKKPPSWYQGKGIVIELADFNELTGSGAGLCTVATYTAWHDYSGGIYQLIFAGDGNPWRRKNVGADGWTDVVLVNDGGNANTVGGLQPNIFARKDQPNTFTLDQRCSGVWISREWGTFNGDNGGRVFLGANMHTNIAGQYVATQTHNSGATGLSLNLFNGDLIIHRQNSPVTVGQVLSPTTFNVTQEINNLKSSVVNGKQTVVNAINDKVGHNTGLTTNHTFDDYAWHIRNSIVALPGNNKSRFYNQFILRDYLSNSNRYYFNNFLKDEIVTMPPSGTYPISLTHERPWVLCTIPSGGHVAGSSEETVSIGGKYYHMFRAYGLTAINGPAGSTIYFKIVDMDKLERQFL